MNKPQGLADLGPIMQLAFCPRDYDAALGHWLRMGAGPFFERNHVAMETVHYRGEPVDIDISLAIGYFGDLQIEIVRQHGVGRSIYSDWLAQGLSGLHHVGVLVDDIAVARDRALSAGCIIVQEAILAANAGAVIYVDTGGGPGTMMEFLRIGSASQERFAMMREAHRTWDGSDPLRTSG